MTFPTNLPVLCLLCQGFDCQRERTLETFCTNTTRGVKELFVILLAEGKGSHGPWNSSSKCLVMLRLAKSTWMRNSARILSLTRERTVFQNCLLQHPFHVVTLMRETWNHRLARTNYHFVLCLLELAYVRLPDSGHWLKSQRTSILLQFPGWGYTVNIRACHTRRGITFMFLYL